MKKRSPEKWVAVSGGFDPIHMGHIRYFKEAKKLGDKLVVIVNNDNWLKKKKGFVFMPEDERIEIIQGIKMVDRVIVSAHKKNDSDMSVSRELKKLRPLVFANGGDRRSEKDIPEAEVCKRYGIKMVFGVGSGGKVQSSSWLVNKVATRGLLDVRPWGYMHTYRSEPHFWIKTINVSPQRRLSLQKHQYRAETWVCVEGEVTAQVGSKKRTLKLGDSISFPPNTVHRLSSEKGGTIVEVAFGKDVNEKDIVRLEDDHGRV